jgi:hypothetical protein
LQALLKDVSKVSANEFAGSYQRDLLKDILPVEQTRVALPARVS